MSTRITDGLGFTRGNPLRPFMIGYMLFNAMALLAALVVFAFDLDPVYLWLTLIWPLGAPVVLAVIWFINIPYARDLNELRNGHAIARWEPRPEEWAKFEDAEWSRARRDAKLAPMFGLVIAIVLGAFVLVFSEDVTLAVVAAGIGMVLGLAVSATSYLFGRLRFRRRDTRTGEVLFSERGVLQPSGYLPFRGVNLTLVDVVIEDGEPAVLRFRVGSVTENFTTREQVFRVPIPKGREADAADLAAYLQGKTVPVRDRPTATSVATT